MKRSSSSVGPEHGRAKAVRRQDPVSCDFCRKKKLKCDRNNPCSNCRARALPCSSECNAQQCSPAPAVVSKEGAPSRQPLEELNSRLRRIEELLAARSPLDCLDKCTEGRQITSSDTTIVEAKNDPEEDELLSRTLSSMENDHFQHVPVLDSHNVFTESILADDFGSFFLSLSRPRNNLSLRGDLKCLLPHRKQGKKLLDHYINSFDWIYRILHVPTVNRIFNDLYAKLDNGQMPSHGHLALISTIFATSAFFYSPPSRLFFTREEAVSQSHRLSILAQDTLAASNCLSKPSIETLQSLIILSQWLMPNIGAIATLRTLSSTLMHTARSMGMHLTDSAGNKRWRTQNQVDWVEVEVKRRIWWHITSMDWLLSFMGGSQNGTYMVQPKHMKVEFPSNVSDISITADGKYAQPEHVATEMSFFRFRCRCTVMFREVVDASWEAGSEMQDLPYETVLEFDKKFNNIIIEFDTVFDKARNVLSSIQAEDPRYVSKPSLSIHWAMAHFCMDSRFARLHRPYLIRGAKNPKYAYSRMVCLRSARSMMELGNSMLKTAQILVAFKLWAINHDMYVATIILVMDYCYNRDEPRAKERRQEILECFQALRRNDKGAITIPAGLNKLEKIFRDATGSSDRIDNDNRCISWLKTPADGQNSDSQLHKKRSKNMGDNALDNPSFSAYANSCMTREDSLNNDIAQQACADFDFGSSLNTDFDSDLNTSLFDELFHNLESNSDLI